MKRVLIVASVLSFIEWFNKDNVDFLHDCLGCEVHIACNFDYMNDTDVDRAKAYIEKITNQGIVIHNIHFSRNPLSTANISAYKKLKKVIYSTHFDLIHCHTPTVAMLTRMAAKKARKNGTIVMYTCHGFHFHNASAKKSWLLYYPIERHFSRFCDYIVTINKEDYHRAQTFHCKNVRYIPSVGVDINKIKDTKVDSVEKKLSLGIPKDKIMLLSVGELIERKNHEVIIRALGKLKNPDIYYVIAGKGPLKEELSTLAKELGVADRVMFIGFRTDVYELYHAADISAFPSKIEGLGLAGVEALSAGVPLISSNVHGILDYATDGKTGFVFSPDDVDGFAKAIDLLAKDQTLRLSMKDNCISAAQPFEITNALNVMWDIYREILVQGAEK